MKASILVVLVLVNAMQVAALPGVPGGHGNGPKKPVPGTTDPGKWEKFWNDTANAITKPFTPKPTPEPKPTPSPKAKPSPKPKGQGTVAPNSLNTSPIMPTSIPPAPSSSGSTNDSTEAPVIDPTTSAPPTTPPVSTVLPTTTPPTTPPATTAQPTTAPPTTAPATTAPPADVGGLPDNWRADLMNVINAARSENHLPPLCLNEQLMQTAQGHTDDMVQHNFFSHFSSANNANPFDRMGKAGFHGGSENLAAEQNTTSELFQAFMENPQQKANILNRDYKFVGVGHSYSPTSEHKQYWVLDFGLSDTATCL